MFDGKVDLSESVFEYFGERWFFGVFCGGVHVNSYFPEFIKGVDKVIAGGGDIFSGFKKNGDGLGDRVGG